MEAKPSKSLDGGVPNLKRKWDTRCVEHVHGVSAPTNVVSKQTRLVGDVCKPDGGYSWESEAATIDVKADGHNITTKLGGGKVGIDFKKDSYIDLDDYTESVYGKLDVNSALKLFLRGMFALGITKSDIVEIYRSSGRLMQRRLELFQKQADITKEARGDANVRYAWLACSKKELSTMMKYGLGHSGLSPSKCIYGFGVHLAAIIHPG